MEESSENAVEKADENAEEKAEEKADDHALEKSVENAVEEAVEKGVPDHEVDQALEKGVPSQELDQAVEDAVWNVPGMSRDSVLLNAENVETVTLIGIKDVDTTVELAGQLSTPGEHEVIVVMSVL